MYHLLACCKFLFILYAWMFQIMVVFVTGTILLKCLKKPFGISSYIYPSVFWIWHSRFYIVLMILVAFSSILAENENSCDMVLSWFIWTLHDSKIWDLTETLPSILLLLIIHTEFHSPVQKLDSRTFLDVKATWILSEPYSVTYIKTNNQAIYTLMSKGLFVVLVYISVQLLRQKFEQLWYRLKQVNLGLCLLLKLASCMVDLISFLFELVDIIAVLVPRYFENRDAGVLD